MASSAFIQFVGLTTIEFLVLEIALLIYSFHTCGDFCNFACYKKI